MARSGTPPRTASRRTPPRRSRTHRPSTADRESAGTAASAPSRHRLRRRRPLWHRREARCAGKHPSGRWACPPRPARQWLLRTSDQPPVGVTAERAWWSTHARSTGRRPACMSRPPGGGRAGQHDIGCGGWQTRSADRAAGQPSERHGEASRTPHAAGCDVRTCHTEAPDRSQSWGDIATESVAPCSYFSLLWSQPIRLSLIGYTVPPKGGGWEHQDIHPNPPGLSTTGPVIAPAVVEVSPSLGHQSLAARGRGPVSVRQAADEPRRVASAHAFAPASACRARPAPADTWWSTVRVGDDRRGRDLGGAAAGDEQPHRPPGDPRAPPDPRPPVRAAGDIRTDLGACPAKSSGAGAESG